MDTDAVLGALALEAVEGIVLYGVGLLVAGGIGAMLGTLMFGRRYKQRIAALEARTAQTINITVERNGGKPKEGAGKEAMFHIAEGLPDGPDGEKRWRVGTVNGPMTVRLNHEKTLDDVLRILRENNVLASLSDEYESKE